MMMVVRKVVFVMYGTRSTLFLNRGLVKRRQ